MSDWPHWAALVYEVYIFERALSSLLSLALYYHISTTDHQALFAFVLVIVTLRNAPLRSTLYYSVAPKGELRSRPRTGKTFRLWNASLRTRP